VSELISLARSRGYNVRGLSQEQILDILKSADDDPVAVLETKVEDAATVRNSQRISDLEQDVEALKVALSGYADKQVKVHKPEVPKPETPKTVHYDADGKTGCGRTITSNMVVAKDGITCKSCINKGELQ